MSLSQGIKNPQKEWMFKGLSITIPSIKKLALKWWPLMSLSDRTGLQLWVMPRELAVKSEYGGGVVFSVEITGKVIFTYTFNYSYMYKLLISPPLIFSLLHGCLLFLFLVSGLRLASSSRRELFLCFAFSSTCLSKFCFICLSNDDDENRLHQGLFLLHL